MNLLDDQQRKISIVARMRDMAELIISAARTGDLVGARFESSGVRRRADNLTTEALALFVPGEEEIAWWTQVEFYAGLAEPLSLLTRGEPLLDEEGVVLFTPPRFAMLSGWAEKGLPGPRFRGQSDSAPSQVDTAREDFVVPYSEAPEAMIWAPIVDWRKEAARDEGQAVNLETDV